MVVPVLTAQRRADCVGAEGRLEHDPDHAEAMIGVGLRRLTAGGIAPRIAGREIDARSIRRHRVPHAAPAPCSGLTARLLASHTSVRALAWQWAMRVGTAVAIQTCPPLVCTAIEALRVRRRGRRPHRLEMKRRVYVAGRQVDGDDPSNLYRIVTGVVNPHINLIVENQWRGIRNPPMMLGKAIGHLEKYSLDAGRSAIEVAAVSV
jgi:hypothetical protein